jgi:DNA-binding CsgD family transcriptional regulator
MRVAAPLALRTGDREKLAKLAASRAGEAGLARRARIVLLAADGLAHTEVAERCGTSVPTVRHWRSRYVAAGIRALEDLPRSGRPRSVDEVKIVVTTLEPPPKRLGVTHWSSAAGPRAGRLHRQRHRDLAQVGPAAVAAGELQVLH